MNDRTFIGILLLGIALGGLYLQSSGRLIPTWDILSEPNSNVPFWRFALALTILFVLLSAIPEQYGLLLLLILLMGAIYYNSKNVPENESLMDVISHFASNIGG